MKQKIITRWILKIIAGLVLVVLCVLAKWKWDCLMSAGSSPAVKVNVIQSEWIYETIFALNGEQVNTYVIEEDDDIIIRHQLKEMPNLFSEYKLTDFDLKCSVVSSEKREILMSLLEETKTSINAAKDDVLVIEKACSKLLGEEKYDIEVVVNSGGHLKVYLIVSSEEEKDCEQINIELMEMLYKDFLGDKSLEIHSTKTETLHTYENQLLCIDYFTDDSLVWSHYSMVLYVKEKTNN